MNNDELLIRTFIHPDRRERFLALLSKRDGRRKLTDLFAHRVELDLRYATIVPTDKQTVAEIEKLLKIKAAPSTCYVLSENSELDGKEMQLSQALDEIVGRGMGSFVSCIPGKLAYYEGEDISERYILYKAAV